MKYFKTWFYAFLLRCIASKNFRAYVEELPDDVGHMPAFQELARRNILNNQQVWFAQIIETLVASGKLDAIVKKRSLMIAKERNNKRQNANNARKRVANKRRTKKS